MIGDCGEWLFILSSHSDFRVRLFLEALSTGVCHWPISSWIITGDAVCKQSRARADLLANVTQKQHEVIVMSGGHWPLN